MSPTLLGITDCVPPRVLWFSQTGTAVHAGWPLEPPGVFCRGWQGPCSHLARVISPRNKDTTRDEFIFYSKRLMRLLIEHALSFLPLKVSDHPWVQPQPHLPCWVGAVTQGLALPTLLVLPFLQSVTVETPQGTMYEGKRFHRQRVRHNPAPRGSTAPGASRHREHPAHPCPFPRSPACPSCEQERPWSRP